MNIRAVVLAAVVAAGCGGTDNDGASAVQQVRIDNDPSALLVTVDSIGIEIGDTNYVMGGVEGIAFGPDGCIAVLDCGRSTVRIYSPEGEYLRSIGRRGNGPGELGNVTSMAISEGGYVFLSGIGSETTGLHTYDYGTGEWLGTYRTFVPPGCLEGAGANRYVRRDIDFEVDGDDVFLPVSISMYEAGNDEPITTYFEEKIPFDPADEVGLLELDWYGYDVAVGLDGSVFIAPRSTTEALVFVFDPAGSRTGILELPYERAERSSEEMEMERNILRAKAVASGENTEGLEPDPYKPMIRGLETDGDGNLWVLQGGPSVPTFTVLDPSGGFFCTAKVSGDPPDGSTWRFCFDESGILAYAEDPACGFQKVYVLQARFSGE